MRADILLAVIAALSTAACDRGSVSREEVLPPLAAAAAKGAPAMALTGRVVDNAKLLSTAEAKALSDKLQALEYRTKVQFTVATTPSLGGKEVLFYSLDLARNRGLGDKARNDGLLLLVAPKERKARIEVGKGLERALPDDLCARIMREDILPHFKAGDYPAGIDAGADALIAVLDARMKSNRT